MARQEAETEVLAQGALIPADWRPDRKKLKDPQGRFVTQSLFQETAGNYDLVVYTLAEEDKMLENGKVLPSLKRLYLLESDVGEFEFANKYLFSWLHWQRLQNNAMIKPYIDQWREELGYKLRSEGLKQMLLRAKTDTSCAAAKYLADGAFKRRAAGRPSKEEIEGHMKENARLEQEFASDLGRIEHLKIVSNDK